VTHGVEEAIEIADRIVLLSSPPARLLGDVRIQNPRSIRTTEEIAAIRNRIAEKIGVADQTAAGC
jgi:NitT/TauT family transport system ATP-binding protein